MPFSLLPNTDSFVKTATKKQIFYRYDAKVKSSVATVSVDARTDVKAWEMLQTRFTLTHDIPALLPRDTVSMATKLARRIKNNYWNGIVQAYVFFFFLIVYCCNDIDR